jgi:hypothetical protein
MNQVIKASLDFFLAISVLIAFGQDIYKLNLTPTAPGASSTPTNQTVVNEIPEMSDVVVFVTDNLRKPLQEFYSVEKINIKTEPYKFEGAEWWF